MIRQPSTIQRMRRSASFVPSLIAHLLVHAKFTCKLSELPRSYQDQPYNLSAKLLKRGGIDARVVVNRDHNTFSLIRFGIKKLAVKPKTKKHVRNNHTQKKR